MPASGTGASAGAEGQGPPRCLAPRSPCWSLASLSHSCPLLWATHCTEAPGRRLIRIWTTAAADKHLQVTANRNLQANNQGLSAYECSCCECISTRSPLSGADFPHPGNLPDAVSRGRASHWEPPESTCALSSIRLVYSDFSTYGKFHLVEFYNHRGTVLRPSLIGFQLFVGRLKGMETLLMHCINPGKFQSGPANCQRQTAL